MCPWSRHNILSLGLVQQRKKEIILTWLKSCWPGRKVSKQTIYSFSWILTFVLGAVLLSTHNICFGWEIRKIIFKYTLLPIGFISPWKCLLKCLVIVKIELKYLCLTYLMLFLCLTIECYVNFFIVVVGAAALCLFPLWPDWMRILVYYCSLLGASFVGFMLFLIVRKYPSTVKSCLFEELGWVLLYIISTLSFYFIYYPYPLWIHVCVAV